MQAESRMFCRSGYQAWPWLGTGSPWVSNVSVGVHVCASVQVVSLASSSPCRLISWSKLWLLRSKRSILFYFPHISLWKTEPNRVKGIYSYIHSFNQWSFIKYPLCARHCGGNWGKKGKQGTVLVLKQIEIGGGVDETNKGETVM